MQKQEPLSIITIGKLHYNQGLMQHNFRRLIFINLLLWAIPIKAQLVANPQNFYQQHLRNSRVASQSHESDADMAMGKLAARLSGKKQPCRHSLPIRETLASPEDIAALLKLEPGFESLTAANKLKSRLTRPNLSLDEYIARCYWSTKQNVEATRLSTALLQQIESPALRRLLFAEALKSGDHSLARHHLAKTGLSGKTYLTALTQIILAEAGFPMLILAVLFTILALTLCWLSIKRLLKPRQPRSLPSPESPPTTVPPKPIQPGDNQKAPQTAQPVSPVINEALSVTDGVDKSHSDHQQKDSSSEEAVPGSSKINSDQAHLKFKNDNSVTTDKTHFTNELGFISEDTARLFFLALQLAVSERMLRIIGITSTTQDTNKALAAMQLARRFSEDDYKTLLIDANNHGPFLNEIADCEQSPGLSELINSESPFSTVCRQTSHNQLSLITCGNQLSGFIDMPDHAWERLLSYCRSNFEIIVIILPASINLSDRLTLLQQFGLILIEDYTNDTNESAAIELLKSDEGITVLGRIKLSNQQ